MRRRPLTHRGPPIFILVATFNGEGFLPEQLESLRRQSDGNWIALIRDDGSRDQTLAIVQRYAAADARFVLLEPSAEPQGACANFACLLEAAYRQGAELFALCDQDDVWHVDKLAHMRAVLDEAASRGAGGTPLLAYADLSLIDESGRMLSTSHFAHAGAAQVGHGVGAWLLAHNLVPGCAMVGNRALLDVALPVPAQIGHHDWWLVLLAAMTGEVLCVDEVLTGYRQHRRNAVGARSPLQKLLRFTTGFRAEMAHARKQYWLAPAQVAALLVRIRDRGFQGRTRWLDEARAVLAGLGAARRLRRIRGVVRGPVRRLGFARNVLMLIAAWYDPAPDVRAWLEQARATFQR